MKKTIGGNIHFIMCWGTDKDTGSTLKDRQAKLEYGNKMHSLEYHDDFVHGFQISSLSSSQDT